MSEKKPMPKSRTPTKVLKKPQTRAKKTAFSQQSELEKLAHPLASAIVKGQRRQMAKAITLVESARTVDRKSADNLIKEILPFTGNSLRIGLSGTPGVGKSTFIEAFGTFLTEKGLRVAVLAIDPSSARSGGSILGDKTRMELLSRNPLAYIRPSPAGTTLGGVARHTREAMLIVEAAGFDVILVETVGVGQSETAVADMVDLFMLLLAPGGGDELQGIKRGIMELADMVVINKADGELLPAAKRAAADYHAALHLMRPKYKDWQVPVLLASALANEGIEKIWEDISKFQDHMKQTGQLDSLRSRQSLSWMWSEIRDGLIDTLAHDDNIRELTEHYEREVREGRCTPSVAAREILEKFISRS